ncbi:hypothetical protein [Microbacterium halotolerans]|uniref:hypothetical protein n=1 Tax=Microbacterium halotolerans TaxID=246613 RepID=UPI000E6AABD5|nr:hypothetical protein [Microbacterium halotolerans]
MIIEQVPLRDRVWDAITESLVPAAVQSPEDEIATHVVPHDADGALYCIEGVLDIGVLVSAVVDEIWDDHERESNGDRGD